MSGKPFGPTRSRISAISTWAGRTIVITKIWITNILNHICLLQKQHELVLDGLSISSPAQNKNQIKCTGSPHCSLTIYKWVSFPVQIKFGVRLASFANCARWRDRCPILWRPIHPSACFQPWQPLQQSGLKNNEWIIYHHNHEWIHHLIPPVGNLQQSRNI